MFAFFCLLSLVTTVNCWTPIGSIYNMNSLQSVIIHQKEYVVWKYNQSNVIVQDNMCLHRHAPLSEGRIVNATLECPYHGWCYSDSGTIKHIPQGKTKQSIRLQTYETKRFGDIVWANLELDTFNDSNAFLKRIQKDEVLSNAHVPYIREVPYSWSYLVENFFDPAHVPFAHHGMQSVRSDGCNIPMQMVHFTPDKLVLLFQDQSMGKQRDGMMEFYGPYLYCLSFRDKNSWKRSLTILCVPVRVGKSRVFVIPNQSFSPDQRRIHHEWSNQFFNTDDYLVHKQEVNHAKNLHLPYFLPTSSDVGIRQWHKWMNRFYPEWNFQNKIEITKEEAIDNDKNHIQFCRDCQK